jgi:hypothetical protein
VIGFRRAGWAAALVLVAGLAVAAPQAALEHSSFGDFQAGNAEGVAVLGAGALEFGVPFAPHPGMQKPEAFVWALAADSRGRVYAGTGNAGRVLRLEEEKAETVLEADDLMALSLAVGKDDAVYAACAPSGTVYRIPPKGKAAVFCKTGEAYVWALAAAPNGGLYAATGPEGRLLRISPKGRNVKTVFDSTERHILSLAAAPDGAAYAGTSDNGLVYRIDRNGKISVVFDALEQELRCLAVDPAGNVYVGTADGIRAKVPGAPRPGAKAPAAPKGGGGGAAMSTKKETRTTKRPPGGVPPKRAGGSTVASANSIYRIAPDGGVTELFRMKGIAFVSMAWQRGALFVGTADEGKVLRIVSERDTAVVAELPETQVLSLCGRPDGALFAGTGSEGRVYRAGSARGESGTYTSVVYDARFRATWGACQVDAEVPRGTSVRL